MTAILPKNCNIIYPPKGRAGEYHELATSLYRGCGHQCIYCYVPQVLHMSRAEFDQAAIPRTDILNRLTQDAKKYQAAGITGNVMMSFTTDPYNHADVALKLTRKGIEIIQEYGLGVTILTKGGRRALRDLDLMRPGRDQFACTLTSLDEAVSMEWEAGAALPAERIEVLETFHNAGIYTWVSLEPVYDTEATLEIIRQTYQFVNLFKLGKINYHRIAKRIDWFEFTAKALATFKELNANYFLKADLHPYLENRML